MFQSIGDIIGGALDLILSVESDKPQKFVFLADKKGHYRKKRFSFLVSSNNDIERILKHFELNGNFIRMMHIIYDSGYTTILSYKQFKNIE